MPLSDYHDVSRFSSKMPRPRDTPLDPWKLMIELRRRKQEIGWEKKQLDSKEANVDKAIALLEDAMAASQRQCVPVHITVKKAEEKNMEEDLVEEEDVTEEDEQDAMVALHFAITVLQKVRKELLALQQQQQKKKKHEQLHLTVKKEEEKNMEEDLVEEEDVIKEDEMAALHFATTLLQKVRKELLALQQQQKKKLEQRAFVEAAAAEAAAAFDAGSWG